MAVVELMGRGIIIRFCLADHKDFAMPCPDACEESWERSK